MVSAANFVITLNVKSKVYSLFTHSIIFCSEDALSTPIFTNFSFFFERGFLFLGFASCEIEIKKIFFYSKLHQHTDLTTSHHQVAVVVVVVVVVDQGEILDRIADAVAAAAAASAVAVVVAVAVAEHREL